MPTVGAERPSSSFFTYTREIRAFFASAYWLSFFSRPDSHLANLAPAATSRARSLPRRRDAFVTSRSLLSP